MCSPFFHMQCTEDSVSGLNPIPLLPIHHPDSAAEPLVCLRHQILHVCQPKIAYHSSYVLSELLFLFWITPSAFLWPSALWAYSVSSSPTLGELSVCTFLYTCRSHNRGTLLCWYGAIIVFSSWPSKRAFLRCTALYVPAFSAHFFCSAQYYTVVCVAYKLMPPFFKLSIQFIKHIFFKQWT